MWTCISVFASYPLIYNRSENIDQKYLKLEIDSSKFKDLDLILKERRIRWYGHVERSNGAVKTAFNIQIDGKPGPGRPKMTWRQLTERDCREWKLSAINPHDRGTWRSGARSAVHAASHYLEGVPLMWILPLYLHVNQDSNMTLTFFSLSL